MKVRAGLQALAVAWGAPVDDLEKGYHETMTQAWVRLVHLTLSDCGVSESADAFCDQQPQLMQKTRLELFYSRERLMTWEAKREFIEPDVGAEWEPYLWRERSGQDDDGDACGKSKRERNDHGERE